MLTLCVLRDCGSFCALHVTIFKDISYDIYIVYKIVICSK